MSVQENFNNIDKNINQLNRLRPMTERLARTSYRSDDSNITGDDDNTDSLPEIVSEEMISESKSDTDETIATSLPITNKFAGRIADCLDPYKTRLKAYTVSQYLAECDTKIARKKLTNETEKIKEAHLLVSADKVTPYTYTLPYICITENLSGI